ncbi:MAG: hypothetical protein NTV34_05765, partial [Proteobacteria bacterium]|nr:hypothetical protein [Pseudomonadota bacterium]
MTDFRSTSELTMTGLSPKIQGWIKRLGKDGLAKLESNVTSVLLVIGGGYLFATAVSGLIMTMMMTSIISSRTRLGTRASDAGPVGEVSVGPARNTRDIAKTIKERNLFNSEGKFPEEKGGLKIRSNGSVFDIDGPCRPTVLPIELMGTIYLGDRLTSIATVRDKAYSEADIYRAGDEIYGSEGALIAAVDRQAIIINNQGVKECIELNKPIAGQGSDGFP